MLQSYYLEFPVLKSYELLYKFKHVLFCQCQICENHETSPYGKEKQQLRWQEEAYIYGREEMSYLVSFNSK